MGKVVYANIDFTMTSDATQDIWSLMAPSGNKLKLHGFELTSNATTAAILDLTLKFISAVGSGGSTVTEVNADQGDDGTIVGSVRTGDTTPGTAENSIMTWQWEQLGAVGIIFTQQMRPVIDVSKGIALVCNTAATPELSGFVCWEEI